MWILWQQLHCIYKLQKRLSCKLHSVCSVCVCGAQQSSWLQVWQEQVVQYKCQDWLTPRDIMEKRGKQCDFMWSHGATGHPCWSKNKLHKNGVKQAVETNGSKTDIAAAFDGSCPKKRPHAIRSKLMCSRSVPRLRKQPKERVRSLLAALLFLAFGTGLKKYM
jgi:hypothetical protein